MTDLGLGALFEAYARDVHGIAVAAPAFAAGFDGPTVRVTLRTTDGATDRVVTGRMSGPILLAARFWRAVPGSPVPPWIPSLTSESGWLGDRHSGHGFPDPVAAAARAVADHLLGAGERDEAVLIHRLLTRVDALHRTSEPSLRDVPAHLRADIAYRDPVVHAIRSQEWTSKHLLDGLEAAPDPADPRDRLAWATHAEAATRYAREPADVNRPVLRRLLQWRDDDSAVGMVALGAIESQAIELYRCGEYAAAIDWLTAGIEARVRVRALAAARWECRLAMGDPDPEDDWRCFLGDDGDVRHHPDARRGLTRHFTPAELRGIGFARAGRFRAEHDPVGARVLLAHAAKAAERRVTGGYSVSIAADVRAALRRDLVRPTREGFALAEATAAGTTAGQDATGRDAVGPGPAAPVPFPDAGRSLHAYGWSVDTPGHLQSLVDGDAAARAAARAHIDGAVIHQGSFSAVAPIVFATVVDLVREPRGAAVADRVHRAELADLLVELVDEVRAAEAESDSDAGRPDAGRPDAGRPDAGAHPLDLMISERYAAGGDAQGIYDDGYGDDVHRLALRRCRDLLPAARAALAAARDRA